MATVVAEKTDRDWQIEQAADTLLRAKEIAKDKKLRDAALKVLKKRQAAISEALKQSSK